MDLNIIETFWFETFQTYRICQIEAYQTNVDRSKHVYIVWLIGQNISILSGLSVKTYQTDWA